MKIYTPIVEYCNLQIRMNLRTQSIDIRSCKETKDMGLLERSAQFVRAIVLGFSVEDSLVLIKMGDVFLDSFDVCDVKRLKHDHLSRALGRIIGKDGKTKGVIESSSKTRIVVNEGQVHILGSVENINVAKDAVSRLIIGSQPGKVYNRLRVVSSKLKEKYGSLETVNHNFS
jgi:RNA-binding protein PNO1